MKKIHDMEIAVVGLGYVGLPVAVAMAEKYSTIGFDIDPKRINELKEGIDLTMEITDTLLLSNVNYSADRNVLESCDVYIVTVPTPVDVNNSPDLSALIAASKMISKYLCKGNIVIYESTVYPGATEEILVPILEKYSSLNLNEDFFVGYSPERINPGDTSRSFKNITKITSGSNEKSAEIINDLYASVLNVETYKAHSIKVAEAAKVIENCQRDLNIAFVNELSQIFHLMKIDTTEVLQAASTKWNFHQYFPGMVGGHCIGVDPYYLVEKAKQLNFNSRVILAGRDTNENMPSFIASEIIRTLSEKNVKNANARMLILGAAFKENCPDFRNSKVSNLIKCLNDSSIVPDLHDPFYSQSKRNMIMGEFNWSNIDHVKGVYDLIVISVAHTQYEQLGLMKIKEMGTKDVKIFDLKALFPKNQTDFRL